MASTKPPGGGLDRLLAANKGPQDAHLEGSGPHLLPLEVVTAHVEIVRKDLYRVVLRNIAFQEVHILLTNDALWQLKAHLGQIQVEPSPKPTTDEHS